MATFEIKWNQTLFVVDLTPQEYNVMTVKDLKLRCQTLAQLKPDYYKLLAHGALLKEDDKLIKEYKIATGSKVILMGCKVKQVYTHTYIRGKINTLYVETCVITGTHAKGGCTY
ncbi:hypothetical protein BDB01DRAFT_386012 [Pilobolus umbonatus]|nr:hypothetical protein BDB01DRAFT_386012 [Pilobolus umbonatus]